MKRIAATLFFSLVFSFSLFAQTDSEIKTVELFSPLNADGSPNFANYEKRCFSFITETLSCGSAYDISYGRWLNNEKDWFQAIGVGYRNKLKSLGMKNWTDDFKVPVVKPYAKLKPGENRFPDLSRKQTSASVNISDGSRNTGGSSSFDSRKGVFTDFKDSNDIPSVDSSKSSSGSVKYYPFEKVVPGNMYVMRVVDEKNDFYVLFRVDELEKGKRAKISWKRIEAPKED